VPINVLLSLDSRFLSPGSPGWKGTADSGSSGSGFSVIPSSTDERLRLAEKRWKLADKRNKKRQEDMVKLIKEQGQVSY